MLRDPAGSLRQFQRLAQLEQVEELGGEICRVVAFEQNGVASVQISGAICHHVYPSDL